MLAILAHLHFCCTFASAVFILEKEVEVEDQLKKWKAYYQKDNINQ